MSIYYFVGFLVTGYDISCKNIPLGILNPSLRCYRSPNSRHTPSSSFCAWPRSNFVNSITIGRTNQTFFGFLRHSTHRNRSLNEPQIAWRLPNERYSAMLWTLWPTVLRLNEPGSCTVWAGARHFAFILLLSLVWVLYHFFREVLCPFECDTVIPPSCAFSYGFLSGTNYYQWFSLSHKMSLIVCRIVNVVVLPTSTHLIVVSVVEWKWN